jgi:hypothetical protein
MDKFMVEPTREPPGYVVGRVLAALAEDERTNILDLTVSIAGGKLFILGEVETHERRIAVEMVVRENTPPGMEIVNELWLREFSQPPSMSERLP